MKDAIILLRESRFSGAIYLMGYALELSLKRKIGHTLGFTDGFPENKTELSLYRSKMETLNINDLKIGDIKNHNLNKLIQYSGAERRIKLFCYTEWLTIQNWSPEDRYKIRRYSEEKAKYFMASAKLILLQMA